MKKLTAFILCCLLVLTTFTPAVMAVSVESDIEKFDDGSYMTFTYEKPGSSDLPEDEIQDSEEASPTAITKILRWLKNIFSIIFAKQSTVTKTKYCNYFDKEGNLLWSVYLVGKFTYNHRKAVCVSSEISYDVKDTDWKLLSSSSTEKENTAVGNFVVKQYKLGVPLKEIEGTLTLTCDKNGNVTA